VSSREAITAAQIIHLARFALLHNKSKTIS